MKLYLWLALIPSTENFDLDITAVVWAKDSIAAWDFAMEAAKEEAVADDAFFDPGEYRTFEDCLIRCIALDDVKPGVANLSTARIGSPVGRDTVSGVHAPTAGVILSGGPTGANPGTDQTESEG